MPATRDLTSVLSCSSSFSNFDFSYRRLFIALRSRLIRNSLLSLWFVYGKLKFMNFDTTLNLLQVNKILYLMSLYHILKIIFVRY